MQLSTFYIERKIAIIVSFFAVAKKNIGIIRRNLVFVTTCGLTKMHIPTQNGGQKKLLKPPPLKHFLT